MVFDMRKIKVLFFQTLLISTAILFVIGMSVVIDHFAEGSQVLNWKWYWPISVVLTGFLCALPTAVLLDLDNLSKRAMWIRIGIHFVTVGAVVSLCGLLFEWYDTVSGYLGIIGAYIVIYVFVWVATLWIAKTDEKKINEAIKDMRDSE